MALHSLLGTSSTPPHPRGRKCLVVQSGKSAEVITESISPKQHQQIPSVGGSREFHLEISLACDCLAAEQAVCPLLLQARVAKGCPAPERQCAVLGWGPAGQTQITKTSSWARCSNGKAAGCQAVVPGHLPGLAPGRGAAPGPAASLGCVGVVWPCLQVWDSTEKSPGDLLTFLKLELTLIHPALGSLREVLKIKQV